MAVRFDSATTDALRVSSGILDYNAAYTIMAWVYPVSNPAADMQPFSIAVGGSNLDQLRTGSAATSWSVRSLVGGTAVASGTATVSYATWQHLAMVRTDASNLYLYKDGVQSTASTQAVGARSAAIQLDIGNGRAGTTPLNGRVYAIKAWTVALSTAEILQEMRSVRPVRLANLWGWWPARPGATERLKDYSGNGRSFTEVGTLTDEDPPPISWGARTGFRPRSGGTQYLQSLAGTLSSSGVLVRRTGKALAGTLSSSGAVARRANKPLAGTLTSSGAATKRTSKSFAGTLTSSGALSVARIFLKALAGTLTSSGVLTRRTGKALAGALTSNGALLKRSAKNAAGTLTPSGTLAGVRAFLKAIGGTLTSSGALVRRTGKTVAGTLTSSGAVARQIRKTIAGTLGSSGALLKRTAKLVGGTLSSSGVLVSSRLVAWLRHIFQVPIDNQSSVSRLASRFSVGQEDRSSTAQLGGGFTVGADDRTSEV